MLQDIPPDITLGLRQQRLRILDQDETGALYLPPSFTQEEREQYFALPSTERATLNELKTTKSKLSFTLQLGYFKARRLFFVVTANYVSVDFKLCCKRYLPAAELDCTVSSVTRLKQQGLILALFRYKICDESDRHHMGTKAREAAMMSSKKPGCLVPESYGLN